MRDIKDYHKVYPGKSVTVLSNGPSLIKFAQLARERSARIPPEILDGDWVSINYSFERVGGHDKVKYVFIQELETYYKISANVPNEKLVIPEKPGLNKHGTSIRIKVINPKAIGYTLQDPLQNKVHHLSRKYYGIQKNAHFFCYTTTFQTALHILCYMGFTKIYLVGVDYKLFNTGKMHYDSNYDPNYGSQKMNALNRFREGDDFLIPMLQKTNNVRIENFGKLL